MELKSNKMLQILVAGVLFLACFIGFKAWRANKSPDTEQLAQPVTVIEDITQDELLALGIEGDTSQDTIKTLVTMMKGFRHELDSVQNTNQELNRKNIQLQQQLTNKEEQNSLYIETMLEARQIELKQEQQSLLEALEQKFSHVINRSSSAATDPSGISVGNDHSRQGYVTEEIVWINPVDARQLDQRGNVIQQDGFNFPTSFNNTISESRKEYVEKATGRRDFTSATPVYTLPENSTLIGSIAMTALLGRVPINGTVSDPYPFKVLIGKDNLTANGIDLPRVEGAVMSGTATGDWTLSCVRGQIHSITFVFTDGTIRTVPEPAKSNTEASSAKSIGWLSDDYGLPCIPGERKSNAAEYIGSQFLLSGSAASADAFSNSQTQSIVDSSNVVTAVTGNSGKYILGQAIGGGLKETSDWFKARYGQMFDAIYVPPGHKVAIHITHKIPIDYETDGRKVDFNRYTHQTRRELD